MIYEIIEEDFTKLAVYQNTGDQNANCPMFEMALSITDMKKIENEIRVYLFKRKKGQ